MRTLNKITFALSLFAVALSLMQQVRVPAVSASVAITTWAHAPGDTCGTSKIFAPGSAGIEADNGHIWTCVGSAWVDNNLAYAGVPSGLTAMVVSGSCPSGYTQVTALDAAMPEGTLAAHGDVGGTGGANSITPTVASLTAAAQTFTGNSTAVPAPTISWPAGVPTFSGTAGTVPAQTFSGTPFSSVINHTHTITSTLTVQGGTTAATSGTHVMTSTATGGSARAVTAGDSIASSSANPSGGVASITPAGTNSTAAFTPAGTVAWPAGVPTNSSVNITPLGHTATSAVTGTLNSFDNRGAYVKVIFCTKA